MVVTELAPSPSAAPGAGVIAQDSAYASNRRRLELALVVSVLFWIVAWHWNTAASMAEIWWRSETFAHGMVVYPISIWLIWRARAQLRCISFTPAYGALLIIGAFSFGWLLGDLGSVQAAQHFCLVAMLALSVWAVAGTPIARAIAFPLAFTLLAVPVGEFLLPALIEQTADFTVGALRVSGIPVYREGNNFIVPTGSWSVVEACSGLRYLIASVTLGLLYAYLTYKSLLRRSLFVIASVLVPIVANWVRAYMIVMIGHLSGMKYAVGVDHLLYGWVFFGIVMLLLFWIGSFWREDLEPHAGGASSALPVTPPSSPSGSLAAAICAAALVTLAPTYAGQLQSVPVAPKSIAAPDAVNGWTALIADSPQFRPVYLGARATLDAAYARGDRRVGLFIAYYAEQREGAELISFRNTLVSERERFSNHQLSQRAIAASGKLPDAVQTRLRSHGGDVAVWHWYWVGGRWMLDPRWIKFNQALNKLIGKGDDAAVIVIHTRTEGPVGETDRLLQSFTADMGESIAAALSKVRTQAGAVAPNVAAQGR